MIVKIEIIINILHSGNVAINSDHIVQGNESSATFDNGEKANTQDMEKHLTCEEVAARYGVKLDTIWSWIRQGKLPAIQNGRNYRIKQEDLEKFEQKNTTTN